LTKFFKDKKFIFLSKTSWNYYLHPYRTLYAKELAKNGNDVFWINEPTKNLFKFVRQLLAGKFGNKVNIFTPLLFTPTLHNLNSFNAWMLQIQLFILCGTLNSNGVVLWSVYCHHEKIVKHYPKAYKIYWPGDIFDPNSEREVTSFYDLIMPLTEESISHLKNFYYGKYFLSTTGCDWELFDQEFQKSTKTNYKAENKSIVGYIGNISSFRLDFKILKELVSNSTDWVFTFYGPIEQDRDTLKSVNDLSSFENCKFAGEISYEQVPAAIASFSAGIIPYKLNEFNLGTNPNKFFEYSAMGVPCISTRIPSLQKFSDFIIFADSVKDWSHGIDKAIHSCNVNVNDLRKVAYSRSPKESLKRLEKTIIKS
jgi:glycosyltransferase involved in cell wall biosynthesis